MSLFSKPLLRLHLYGFVFTPKLFPTLVMLILLPILLSLGFWQLGRARFKQNIQSTFAARLHGKPKPIAEFVRDPQHAEYALVRVSGYYDNNHQILVDNRINKHRAGYFVLTPFNVEGTDETLLVNRGWVARLADRKQLPALTPVLGLQTIVGRIKMPPSKTFVLAHERQRPTWPLLIQAINFDQIQVALGQPIYPFMLLLSPQVAHGYLREWKPRFMKPEKHQGYAFQWFALALTLVIIYAVSNTCRKSNERTGKQKRTQ